MYGRFNVWCICNMDVSFLSSQNLKWIQSSSATLCAKENDIGFAFKREWSVIWEVSRSDLCAW